MQLPDLDLSLCQPGTPETIPRPSGAFWVFAYGSLMWNPGFPYSRSCAATLFGYHRRLCLWSIRYRGTQKLPGLVLGLDRGGSCQGYAYQVADENTHRVVEYLCDREMVTGAYTPRLCTIEMESGERAQALTFVSKPDHPHFAPKLSIVETTSIVKNASGDRGPNREYVLNTVDRLNQLNIYNTELHKVARQLLSEN